MPLGLGIREVGLAISLALAAQVVSATLIGAMPPVAAGPCGGIRR